MTRKRVLLIEPPVVGNYSGVMRIVGSIGSLKADVMYPPHDLTMLGGHLRDAGIDFDIFDALGMKIDSWESFEEQLKHRNEKDGPYEAVIFTTTVQTFPNDAMTALTAKTIIPGIKTIAINFLAMASKNRDYMEGYPWVDFLVRRDYDKVVPDLIRNDYDALKTGGLLYWNEEYLKRTPENLLIIPGKSICSKEDIDVIPAHDKLDLSLYSDHLTKKYPMTIMMCSRGCIGACHHCTSKYLNPMRIRPVDSCIKELKFIQSLGIKTVQFWDSELPFERTKDGQAWTIEFLDKIVKEGIELDLIANARSDCINGHILPMMKKAGFHTLRLGADSCSQVILDNMNKMETVEETENAARWIKEMRMTLMTYTTFGHKGETRDTMQKTIKWIKDVIRPDFTTFGIAVPIYGTVFFDYLQDNGYMIEDAENDPNAPPAYSYTDRIKKEGIQDMTSEEMYRIAMEGYRSFYLRPRYILKRLMDKDHLWFAIKNFPYFIKRYVLEPRKTNGG